MTVIRSVHRAFHVLRIMNEKPVWSLQELGDRTGLPKSTLHRSLAALREEGYVRSHEGMYGYYQLTGAVNELSHGVVQQSRLVDAAAPILIATTKRIKWPLSIGVVDGCDLRVNFCTMPYSPYAIRPSSYGRRYTLFESALGRAYFSFCDAGERRILYDLYCLGHPDTSPPNFISMRRMVTQTRTQGYGLRRGDKDSDSSALAVPIMAGGNIVGTMAYSTFSRMLDNDLIKKFLPELRKTADQIGQVWEQETDLLS
ncbi:IclR family transcriptional regulator [Pollutimonas subterranea]|uniref:IclR family transcriptional regulator n=1 Tax=Pollutimonas subterranea TaxID=2045210 RepID=A0A2N4U6Y5_9BURK|nr:helix-turn-helix domain-containing protein [Pollutimonas subterranea]PLC50778.1 IclR family transcriptional regulator [Pollutimonas subterranea]